jgi:signal transduction histidine kinase
MFTKLVNFFLPSRIRNDVTDPRYHELRLIVSGTSIGILLMMLFPLFNFLIEKPVWGYLLNQALLLCVLFSIKFFGHYRLPMTLAAIITYFIIYDWLAGSGLIYSANMSILHMYLLGAIWVDRKYGKYTILSNIVVITLVYGKTLSADPAPAVIAELGNPAYPLTLHLLCTIFFGGFLAYLLNDQEKDRTKIKDLQDSKITALDQMVQVRTEQLNNVRATIARDFHDETGNTLSAITRLCYTLQSKLGQNDEAMPVVRHIIENSRQLYASSKDFLWNLDHNSDHPAELFQYITAYGQHYYNQLGMAFSASSDGNVKGLLPAFASLDIIYIFKEAMTNVVRHAGATEVNFSMVSSADIVIYRLMDNGSWKAADGHPSHLGLKNMQNRADKNNFTLMIQRSDTGTVVQVGIPVH